MNFPHGGLYFHCSTGYDFCQEVLFGFYKITGSGLWKKQSNFVRIFQKINIDDKNKRDRMVIEAWAKPNVEGRRRFRQ